uniref:Cellular repressor of E1A-stimulated genes 2 n=1 Tax=Callorhinchus milii TaxID=7868 RepID=A0A4W3KB08_CALMI|eukprot:gi/632939886/ref/XP_007883473.1/ PREDICTED: protein CREG2 isoform X1 [Callorhinchus milii]
MSACGLISIALLVWTLRLSSGYVLVNSVSWAPANREETVSNEEEVEALPNRLFESGSSIWKASYPSVGYRREEVPGVAELPSPKEVLSFPSRMFSYRREGGRGKESEQSDPPQSSPPPPPPPPEERARTARHIITSSSKGFLATLSSLDQIKGLPFGNIFSISDGVPDNSTGIPFFYVTPKDNSVLDLMKNPNASLTLSEAEGDYCRENLIAPEDLKCARLTLTGKMVTVSPEEVEFAKQAMFSRHPVMKMWPPDHDCFFMKMDIQQIWLQNWFGGVSVIPLEEYFKKSPRKVE